MTTIEMTTLRSSVARSRALRARYARSSPSTKGRTAEGPMEKSVIFTWRNVLFRGFLDEEQELKKCEYMERMGRV